MFLSSFQDGEVSSSSGTIIRPRSGNPGYIVGFPLLSGVEVSEDVSVTDSSGTTSTVTKYSIAQDISGMTMLPKTDGTQSSRQTINEVTEDELC